MMGRKMPRYRLTKKAENDLFELALYGIQQFGVERSRKYRDQLKQRFEELAQQPEQYPLVTHIRKDYRRSVCGVHSIYYRIDNEGVEIVRVLGRQDLVKELYSKE